MRYAMACLGLALTLSAFAAGGEGGGVPALRLGGEGDGVVTEMLVLGPFPNPLPAADAPPGTPRGGFDRDWLAEIGGEANPRVAADTVVAYQSPAGQVGDKAVAVLARGHKLIEWKTLFARTDGMLAYGFVDLVSDAEQDMMCLFGSDDFAKVWFNGELVFAHPAAVGSRGATPGDDQFPLRLRAGKNRLVVKVENGVGGWKSSVQVLDLPRFKAEMARIEHNKRAVRFANLPLRPQGEYGGAAGLLAMGRPFPEMEFENPELAALFIKADSLKLRWFDPDLNEVAMAARPGFHCAYAEAELLDGGVYRRVVPLYVMPAGYSPYRFVEYLARQGFKLPALPAETAELIAPAAWAAGGGQAGELVELGWSLALNDPAGAMWLGEMSFDKLPADAWRVTDYPHVADYLIRLRRKVLGLPEAVAVLAAPPPEPAAAALRPGTEAEAGFKPGAVEKMREAFAAWSRDSGHGFNVVVARHGVVVFNEAFVGDKDKDILAPSMLPEGRITTGTVLELASLTKLHAGVLLGRFLDQGLLDLDDPAAKYLSDWNSGVTARITLRQLMNHTAGLEGHRWWMGLHGLSNPFLDNVARLELTGAAPGTGYSYNAFDMDVVGKVMETVTGQPVFRLMRDGLLAPLGYGRDTAFGDFGYSMKATAMDLARLADMLRQGGAYDGKRYFSKETLAKLMPRPVGEGQPDMAPGDAVIEYGVGTTWMRDLRPGTDPKDRDYIFGENVYAHGAATGAVVRVAPDLDLVVTMARYTPGPDYEVNLSRCLQVVAEQLD